MVARRRHLAASGEYVTKKLVSADALEDTSQVMEEVARAQGETVVRPMSLAKMKMRSFFFQKYFLKRFPKEQKQISMILFLR